jgi:integrase
MEGEIMSKPTRPAKPYPEFPLTAHPAGQWCKKIRGRIHYFGAWSDPDGALSKYLDQKDALHAGRRPRTAASEVTVKDAANAYLNAATDRLNAGELSPRSWKNYKRAVDRMVSVFGRGRLAADLHPDDFADLKRKQAKRWGPRSMKVFVQIVRSCFKHAYDSGLIEVPIRFGPAFKMPSAKTIRVHRAGQGKRLFTAAEVQKVLAVADPTFRAMILLAINCGFGNADLASLPLAAVDLDVGWIEYPRPKTGINRRCPLWTETVEALRAALADRPAPVRREDAGLVFITPTGNSWRERGSRNEVSKRARVLLDQAQISRPGLSFYALRHTFRTVADEARDQPAVDHIMGHEVQHMSAVYRETIADARLRAVADQVHQWLFAPPKKNS